MEQRNKIALVTGSSRGLGKEAALAIARRGIDVIVTYRSKKEEAAEVVAAVEATGQKAIALALDVADTKSFTAFAQQLAGKTTSQLIAERVIQEARALLKHTNWNISEIAWCLGFEELFHFINFFKKNAQVTPKAFRG